MTKFERAKRQTLEKLAPFVLWYTEQRPIPFIECGFCVEYAPCHACPLSMIEGCACTQADWWDDWIKSEGEAEFVFALALYGWIESLHE